MKINIKHLTFLALILFALSSIAQENENNSLMDKKYMISQVPQYFIMNGIRVDYDKRIGNSNQWLVFGPQMYGASKQNQKTFATTEEMLDYYDDNSSYRYDKMYGFGLDFYHKTFVENTGGLPNGVYVAFGPMAQYFNIDMKKVAFVENETTQILEEKVVKSNESIIKFGANFIFGLQDEIVDNLVGDIYLGVGYRSSIFLNGNAENSKFTNFLGYGYTGVTPVMGFRIGLMFP